MQHILTVDSRCMSIHRGKADLAISLSPESEEDPQRTSAIPL
jgi:hypothetical protein